jgi:hypothetical protein
MYGRSLFLQAKAESSVFGPTAQQKINEDDEGKYECEWAWVVVYVGVRGSCNYAYGKPKAPFWYTAQQRLNEDDECVSGCVVSVRSATTYTEHLTIICRQQRRGGRRRPSSN